MLLPYYCSFIIPITEQHDYLPSWDRGFLGLFNHTEPKFRVFCSSKLLQEGLKVGKDLRVEQSLEDLEAKFEPGEKFSFDVVVQLQEMN
jgi:hypothetical protein